MYCLSVFNFSLCDFIVNDAVGKHLDVFVILQDADDFLTSYDAIIAYVNDRDNWPEMEDELRSRGVRSDVQLIFLCLRPTLCGQRHTVFCPVRSCMHPETLLTRYLAGYLTHFHQTYINDTLWDRGECVTICGQKVRVMVEIKYAGNSTFWVC